MASSTLSCIAWDCDSEVDGMRSAFSAMLFSSRVGMNSVPSRASSTPLPARSSRASATKASGARTAAPSIGR